MFIYFDLGNVLLHFNNPRGCRQIGELTGLDPQRVQQVLFDGGLKLQFERGELTPTEYFATFCEQTGCQSDAARWELAGSDIFEVNASIVPVVSQLAAAGHRLGILSNICANHWRFVSSGRYSLISSNFLVQALSFEIGAMKPSAAVYQRAAELAGVEPQEIFYCDDVAENVAAAREAGFDAVQYVTTEAYVAELGRRGIRLNY